MAARKKKRTRTEWPRELIDRLVAAVNAGELTPIEVERQHNVPRGTLWKWRATAAGAPPARRGRPPKERPAAAEPVPDAPPRAPRARPAPSASLASLPRELAERDAEIRQLRRSLHALQLALAHLLPGRDLE